MLAIATYILQLNMVSQFLLSFLLIFGNYTHPFNGPFSGTTQVSQYQKGKTNLDFSEARDSE